MKFISRLYILCCIIIKILCYKIVSRRIFIDIDSQMNTGKVIEYIQYKFNIVTQKLNETYVTLSHILPITNGEISLVDIKSKDTDLNNNFNSQLVNQSVNLFLNRTVIKNNLSKTFIYEYKINRVIKNNSFFYEIPNLSYDEIKAYIEILIQKITENIKPEIYIGNLSSKSFDFIELDKFTVIQSKFRKSGTLKKNNFHKYKVILNQNLMPSNCTNITINLINESLRKSIISPSISLNNTMKEVQSSNEEPLDEKTVELKIMSENSKVIEKYLNEALGIFIVSIIFISLIFLVFSLVRKDK